MVDFKDKATETGEALVKKVLDVGVGGVGPFKGAIAIAGDATRNSGNDREAAVKRVIDTHVRLAGVEGFATGLPGGIATLAAVPADLSAFYILAGRMTAAIAVLRGYNVHDEEVRAAIIVALLGATGNEVLKDFGIEVGTKGLASALKKVPGKLFIEINKKVGFRLVTKAGEHGVINFGKLVPFVGGPIGLGLNVVGMKSIARYANGVLPVVPPQDEQPVALTKP